MKPSPKPEATNGVPPPPDPTPPFLWLVNAKIRLFWGYSGVLSERIKISNGYDEIAIDCFGKRFLKALEGISDDNSFVVADNIMEWRWENPNTKTKLSAWIPTEAANERMVCYSCLCVIDIPETRFLFADMANENSHLSSEEIKKRREERTVSRAKEIIEFLWAARASGKSPA